MNQKLFSVFFAWSWSCYVGGSWGLIGGTSPAAAGDSKDFHHQPLSAPYDRLHFPQNRARNYLVWRCLRYREKQRSCIWRLFIYIIFVFLSGHILTSANSRQKCLGRKENHLSRMHWEREVAFDQLCVKLELIITRVSRCPMSRFTANFKMSHSDINWMIEFIGLHSPS